MIRPANISDIDLILDITKSCALHMIDSGIFQWNEHYPDKELLMKHMNEVFKG